MQFMDGYTDSLGFYGGEQREEGGKQGSVWI